MGRKKITQPDHCQAKCDPPCELTELYARGLCRGHYDMESRTGQTDRPLKRKGSIGHGTGTEISLRIGRELLERVDAVAEASGMTRAEAVRQALIALCDAADQLNAGRPR